MDGGDDAAAAGAAGFPFGAGMDEEDEEDLVHEDDLPDFANAANRNLHARIIEQEKAIAKAERTTTTHQERVKSMRDHLKAVRAEVGSLSAVLEAKKKEVASEDHMKQLSERQIGRVRQDLQRLDGEAERLGDALAAVQSDIARGSEALESFRERMAWNTEELESWSAAQRQKDEDALALEKFTKADDSQIRSLTLELEKLTTEVNEKRRELDKEMTETQAKQIELDKAAEDFRAVHTERSELLEKWRNAVETIQRRDAEIAAEGERYATAQLRVMERQALIADLATQLARVEQDVTDANAAAEAKQRAVGQQRDVYTAAQAAIEAFQNEVDLVKSEMSKAASDLTSARGQVASLDAALEEERAGLASARARLAKVRSRLEQAAAHTDEVSGGAEQREKYVEELQARLEEAQSELDAIKARTYTASQGLFELRNKESNCIAEISGAQSQSKNLSSKIHELDARALRQAELVYAAEFQIQAMERKVARARGERSDEEKQILQARIDELQEDLSSVKEQQGTLSAACKRVREELTTVQRKRAALDEELGTTQSRTDELLLKNKLAGRAVSSVLADKESAMVQHDTLKLEVKRLRETLSMVADNVFSLENRKAQLALSRQERLRALQAHSEVQKGATKLANEERHALALDVNKRKLRIEKLSSKYDTIAAKFKVAGDDADAVDGEGRPSQAYYVIKNAQRREELQREGDELDAAVRQAEREIKALVHTLKALGLRNTQFRAAFHKADPATAVAEEVSSLEAQVKAMTDAMVDKKQELAAASAASQEHGARASAIHEQAEASRAQLDKLRAAKEAVSSESASASASVDSVRRAMDDMVAKLAKSGPHIDADAELAAARASAAQEAVNKVLFTLGQLCTQFPQLTADLHKGAAARGLRVPTALPGGSAARAPGPTPSTRQARAAATRPLSRMSAASARSSGSAVPMKSAQLGLP